MEQEVTNKVFTVANLLTLMRLLLLPVFFVLFVGYQQDLLSFGILAFAALTDLIDGHIARATHTVSKLGQQFDPLVDRIFIIVAVVAIFLVGRLPLWLLIALLVRDATMLILTIYQHKRFRRAFKVVFLGKLTTAFVMAGFCSLVVWWPVVPSPGIVEAGFLPGWGTQAVAAGYWLLYIGTIFSWITACIYLYQGTRPSPDDKVLEPKRELAATAEAKGEQ